VKEEIRGERRQQCGLSSVCTHRWNRERFELKNVLNTAKYKEYIYTYRQM